MGFFFFIVINFLFLIVTCSNIVSTVKNGLINDI